MKQSTYKKIILSQNKFALVDTEDFEKINFFKWYALFSPHTKSFYALRRVKNKRISMARFILLDGKKNKLFIDHINGNTLDNRKCNLRLVTPQQNQMNSKSRRNASSKFKGVSWDNEQKKWKAQIQVNGKNINLGRFDTEEEAAKSYNQEALKLFGEFAYLNKI